MPGLTPFSDSDPPFAIVREYSISRKSTAIYISIILLALLSFASLLFINSPANEKPQAVVQNQLVRYEVLAPVSGTIIHVVIKEDQKVARGDTLLLIEAD